MKYISITLLLLSLRVVVSQAPYNIYCGNAPAEEGSQTPTIRTFQGPPGKQGPQGLPGSVLQCDCSSQNGEVCTKIRRLEEKMDTIQETTEKPPLARSCKEILENLPDSRTGLYKLQDLNGVEYMTYCDMNTDSGGWTLVASVHDNNLGPSGRCTVGDRWSSEQGNSVHRPYGDGNWQNHNTFGQVTKAANDDLKNPGYFEIDARDIMIWHVPNDTPLRDFNTSAYLIYRTTNGFLLRYGGNLHSLFSNHFPIKSQAYSFPGDSGPAIPVVFDRGSGVALMQLHSPNVKLGIETGYIQFRTISTHRDAFAMCPGFRLKPSFKYPGHACLGSTGRNHHIHYCGDTTVLYEGNPAYGTGWTADERLVFTTYLIFYR